MTNRKNLHHILLAGIAIILISCSTSQQSSEQVTSTVLTNTPEVEVEKGIIEDLANENISFTEEEEAAFWKLVNLPNDWNIYSGDFVVAYIDDSIDYEEFLQVGTIAFNNLVDVYNEMNKTYNLLENNEVKNLFLPAINNYYDKLIAMETILEGIEGLDVEMEQEGVNLLDIAANDSVDIACRFYTSLNKPEIKSLLTAEDIKKLDQFPASC
jgi:hypothetical protein